MSTVACPSCAKPMNVRPEWAGRRLGCPHCGRPLAVPSRPAAPAAPAPPASGVRLRVVPDPVRSNPPPEPLPLPSESDDRAGADEDRPTARPRRRRSRPAGRSPLVPILLGLVLLAVCAAGGVGGYFWLVRPAASGEPPGVAPAGGTGLGPLAGVAPRPPLPAGWWEFRHPEGAFRVYVPGPPTRPKNSMSSLDLDRPFAPLEVRESIHEVHPTAGQPLVCGLQVMVFHPSGRAAMHRFEPEAKPRDLPADWVIQSDRQVSWAGRSATEVVVEKSFAWRPNQAPARYYMITRWILSSDRLYMLAIEREGVMPSPAERTAFFDSFVPGD